MLELEIWRHSIWGVVKEKEITARRRKLLELMEGCEELSM